MLHIFAFMLLLSAHGYSITSDKVVNGKHVITHEDTLPHEVLKLIESSNAITEEESNDLTDQDQEEKRSPADYILALVVLTPILLLFGKLLYTIFQKHLNKLFYTIRYRPNELLREEFDRFLILNSSYYNQLDEKSKSKFIRRFFMFYRSKTFDFQYSESQQDYVLFTICAEMARMTMGFSNYYLSDYTQFVLFPDKYFLRQANANAYGHTTEDGSIYLSTKRLLEGVKNDSDGDSLILHELAHVVYLQKSQFEFDGRYVKIYDIWRMFASRHIEEVNQGGSTILDDYAFSNIDEMLAVNTEYFFEQPGKLKAKLPEMFFFLTHLYNQNPLEKSRPILKRKFFFNQIWKEFSIENDVYKNEIILKGMAKLKMNDRIDLLFRGTSFTDIILGPLIVHYCSLPFMVNMLFYILPIMLLIFKFFSDYDVLIFFNEDKSSKECLKITFAENIYYLFFVTFFGLIFIKMYLRG